MRTFYHSELGEIKVIVEVEHCQDYVSSGKHIALVKCYNVPRESRWSDGIDGFKPKSWRTGKLKPEYYMLWGNDSDLNQRGITHIITKNGRAVSERTALKRLHEAHKAADFVTFKPIVR